MLDTQQQIQAPILPESPETGIPQPEGSVQDETALTAEIAELWRLHTDYKGSIKSQTENLRSLRSELGKLLHQMKGLLARPGRNGQWSAWLKERQISRATADRLVTKYERSLNPELNCLNEAIPEPTEEQIQMLLNKVAPKLRRVLQTPASAFCFLDLLTSSFALERKDTEEGFVVLRPVQQTTAVEFVPEEARVAPVPMIAEVLPEGNVESTGSSMAL
jgi:hypothetical protein